MRFPIHWRLGTNRATDSWTVDAAQVNSAIVIGRPMMGADDLALLVDMNCVLLAFPLCSGKRIYLPSLTEYAERRGDVRRRRIYISTHNGKIEDVGMRELVVFKQQGWEVVHRPHQERPRNLDNRHGIKPIDVRSNNGTDARSETRLKSDMDTQLAIDVCELLWQEGIRKFILVTGDSDAIPIVQFITKERGDVHVIGPDDATSNALILEAPSFCYASDVPGFIQNPGDDALRLGPLPQ